ncbi:MULTISPECIES: hypothetical protein [Streptococcus]|uniref:hypothetical protein n=1 Tax=Streptococcus TaxID=1301 RepID=UPI0018A00061|nr:MULTISPECIES: hypothetical protein [Streptococcus]MBF7050556.1 hypothetical protein [Streptococcus sp. HF-2466]
MYYIMDYVGSPTIITKTIKTATEKPKTRQGQAALRMIEKRYFKNFRNQLNLPKIKEIQQNG